jgi:predicted RNA-binding protein YlxR (DUF448 family)
VRGDRAGLLRVVAHGDLLVPDPRARLAGRGAWLHPDPHCLDLAVRRRALPRALRVPGPLDDSAVRAEIDRLAAEHDSTSRPPHPSTTIREHESHEPPMNAQR